MGEGLVIGLEGAGMEKNTNTTVKVKKKGLQDLKMHDGSDVGDCVNPVPLHN